MHKFAMALSAALIAGHASAAVIDVNGTTLVTDDVTGALLGFNRITVTFDGTGTEAAGSTTYTVRFVDGSCDTVYAPCAVPGFDFSSETDALAAATGLAGAFNSLIGTSAARFDQDPELTEGCSDTAVCTPLVPYGLTTGASPVLFAAVANEAGTEPSIALLSSGAADGNDGTFTYARFTAVPLPAAGWLLLGGLAGLGLVRRIG